MPDRSDKLAALWKTLKKDPSSLVFVDLCNELTDVGDYEEAAGVAQRGLLSHPDRRRGVARQPPLLRDRG